jgi:hypothetical protein
MMSPSPGAFCLFGKTKLQISSNDNNIETCSSNFQLFKVLQNNLGDNAICRLEQQNKLAARRDKKFHNKIRHKRHEEANNKKILFRTQRNERFQIETMAEHKKDSAENSDVIVLAVSLFVCRVYHIKMIPLLIFEIFFHSRSMFFIQS